MSWHTGIIGIGAGELITVFDAILPLNSHWSIYDAAAGANCKVYECEDVAGNCLFYLKVDDNQANYAIVGLWEGWDAIGHAGVGQSLVGFPGGSVPWILKHAGGYAISLRDRRFIYCDTVAFMSAYIGQPKRYDLTKNIVIYIGNTSLIGVSTYNALGYTHVPGSGVAWQALFDEGGGSNTLRAFGDQGNKLIIKSHMGTYDIFETPITNNVTGLNIGKMEDAMYLWISPNGLNPLDTITVAGQTWLVLMDPPTDCQCLIEEA